MAGKFTVHSCPLCRLPGRLGTFDPLGFLGSFVDQLLGFAAPLVILVFTGRLQRLDASCARHGIPAFCHAPPQVRQSDYEQAKRELTGEPDIDRQDAILDALPETKRWDPVPGTTGVQTLESPSEDEDDEGRSETEQLVDEGAEEAEGIECSKPPGQPAKRARM